MASRWICLPRNDIDWIIGVLNERTTGQQAKQILKKLEGSKKRITVSSAKGKGRGLQMWVCQHISQMIGIPFDNQDDQCLIHCREMGQHGTDIILRGKAQKLFPFSIECKSSESININSAIEQAKSNKADGTDWMVVFKKKSLPEPVVMINWSTFEKLDWRIK